MSWTAVHVTLHFSRHGTWDMTARSCPVQEPPADWGYAFMQYLGATAASGADLLLELVHFDRLMADADLVVTGEGHADRQTLMGKLPERVLQKALAHGVATWLIAGRADHTEALLRAGFARVESITPPGTDLREAVRPDTARRNLRAWAFRTFGTPASAEEDTHTPA